MKIVRNITYLQENISFIIKQNNKINESITKNTNIKTETQIITNKVNNLTTEFNKLKTLERTVQLSESKIDNISIRLNKVEANITDINKNKKSFDNELLIKARDFLDAKYDYKFRDIGNQLLNISKIFYAISQRLEKIDNYIYVNLEPSDNK